MYRIESRTEFGSFKLEPNGDNFQRAGDALEAINSLIDTCGRKLDEFRIVHNVSSRIVWDGAEVLRIQSQPYQ